jgi:hypothetical protein
MTGEVGRVKIAHKVKVAHQPLHSSIRVNREFSSNCEFLLKALRNLIFGRHLNKIGICFTEYLLLVNENIANVKYGY